MTKIPAIGPFEALGLLFIGLKLGAVINWSWWWVIAPIWMPISAFILYRVVTNYTKKRAMTPTQVEEDLQSDMDKALGKAIDRLESLGFNAEVTVQGRLDQVKKLTATLRPPRTKPTLVRDDDQRSDDR